MKIVHPVFFSALLFLTACAPTRPSRFLGQSEAKLREEIGAPAAVYETEDGLKVMRYLQIAALGRGQYVREPLEEKEDRSLWRQCRDNGGSVVDCSVSSLTIGRPLYLWGEKEKRPQVPEDRYRYTRTVTFIADASGTIVFRRGKDPIYGEWYRPENEFGKRMLDRLHEIEARWREEIVEQSRPASETPEEKPPQELPPAFTVPPPESRKSGK